MDLVNKVSFIKKLVTWLQGKKTYIIALAGVIHAVVITGWQNNDWASAWQQIQISLGLGSLRAGVAKVGK